MIFGIGINDADYIVCPRIDGKRTMCLYYSKWRTMFKRCYSKNYQNQHPTYIGCQVCKEWVHFTVFKTWMETKEWEGNQIDKDILGDGKLYSPEKCCFIPDWLNLLFNVNNQSRGKWPIGVSWNKQKKKFVSHLSINGKMKHLGYFDTPDEAHKCYIEARKEYVTRKIKDYPDEIIRQAVLEKIK